MKKEISFEYFIDRGKAMLYMILLSAVAYVLFAVFNSLNMS
jgi:hypothetical protein